MEQSEDILYTYCILLIGHIVYICLWYAHLSFIYSSVIVWNPGQGN